MNNIIMPLYASLMPNNKSGPVYEQRFDHGKITVALRPLSLPGDWTYISKWMNRELARSSSQTWRLPEKYLMETFSTMLQCDFAQPFIGMLNNRPCFLIELCDGDKQLTTYETGFFIPDSGDHMINIITTPTVINTRNSIMHAMYGSLRYFFSHRQVKRIVWQLHEREKCFINLANQLGYTNNGRNNRRGVHVYMYSREKFMRFSDSWSQQIQKLA